MEYLESKQYTVVSRQNIELWVDSVGNCKVAEEVFDILSEDVTYRLRDLVHNSLKYMKHSKRKCLTVDDLNHAMKESDTEPLFGHGGSDDLSYKGISSKEVSQLCYLDEKDLNLRETASDSSLPTEPGDIRLKASWLVLEGHSCSSGRVDKEDSKNILTEPSESYLQNITSALIGNGSQLRKIALNDLKTNRKLQIIIPHLVSFCSSQIKQHTGKETFSKVSSYVLSTIDALVQNLSVALAPYVVQLAKMMLFILIEAKVPVPMWCIKDKASSILASLSRRNSNTANNLKEQLLKSYIESFNDPSKPLSYFYGAIVGIKELGITAVCQGLYPKAHEKLKMIDGKICNVVTQTEKTELIVILNALMDSLAMLYAPRFESCQIVMERRKSQSFSSVHRELMDVVGESFLMRCLTTNQRYNTTTNINPQNALTNSVSNKNDHNVNGTLKTSEPLNTVSDMNIDKSEIKHTRDAVLLQEKSYIVQSSIGKLSISSKSKLKKFKKDRCTTDGESLIFTKQLRKSTLQQKRKPPRGSHISLTRKKKNMSDLLSQISIQLPIF